MSPDVWIAVRCAARNGRCGGPSQRPKARRTVYATTLFIALTLFFIPLTCQIHTAQAASWPLAGGGLSPSLGFRQSYQAGGSSYSHSGIDIAAAAGGQVLAPVAGAVSFVGSVPSGDSALNGGGSGQTMLAVSVRMGDGRTVTLMPFADTSVQQGQAVAEGAVLGTLAASGDRSMQAIHLHMGLKKNGVYYDPMSLFGLGAAVAASAQEAQSAAATPEAAATQAAAAEAAWLPQVAEAPAYEPGTISSGEAVWSPAVQEETASLLETLAADAAGACKSQTRDAWAGLQDLALRTGVSAVLLALAAVAFAAALMAGCIALIARYAAPWARGAAGKIIGSLCRQGGDGSMHKLFPAPGKPSDPGPLAQRR